VIAEDCPDQPIIANSATGVWTAIVKRANEIRNREHSNSGKTLFFPNHNASNSLSLSFFTKASGPDYYGFTHATIAKMIQDLPGADQCLNYVWQKFGVMHQRTAAGVAAAAQKKLTNLEIMGSANKRAPPPAGEGFVLNKDDSSTTPAPTNDSKKVNPSSTPPMAVKDELSTKSPLVSSSAVTLPAPYISPPLSHTSTHTSSLSSSSSSSTSSATAPAPVPPVLPTVSHHRQLPPSSSTSVLPSLAIMTSTAAAAAAAVDIQQNEILSNQPSSIATPTSLQHHSLHHRPTSSSDISAWSTISR
jgi:hypothetical protein